MTAITTRIRQAPRELLIFISASLVLGFAYSMFDSIFNNFLNANFALTGFQRSFLELPRELPGFLVVFVSAALSFLCNRRVGAVALLLGAVGALLIGFGTTSYAVMCAWLFVYSMGQHLFMPVASAIGMELAREGKTGQRLGQLNAVRNLAAILGSFFVFLGFKYLGFTFQHVFVIAVVVLLAASALMFSMKPHQTSTPKTFLKLRKEYRLYYTLAVISGARKQIFITFAPWVLVQVFNQPTQIMATLFTIGGVIGIMFQPLLGWSVDRFGEKKVLALESIILVFVCLGYGFARDLLPEGTAFLVVCGCFLLDQMLFSVGMARSTYMKKIALQPGDIQPALAAGVSLDHIFSISGALLGGVIWSAFGFQFVFLMGGVIALINLLAVRKMRL
ncbi:MAG: MFS transporter [Anaerolineales bacterium]|nr:MFS transporter [Anaerolineales bacterium]